MAIISTDYDGTASYLFSAHGSNVVLKQNTIYNYYGGGAALSMDVYYAHLLVSGQIYAANNGVSYNSYGSYITVADTGAIFADSGTGIQFAAGNAGAVTINNYGTIAGQTGIDANGATGYVYVFNFGTIQSDREYLSAITLGAASDKVTNTGTIVGDVRGETGNDEVVNTGTIVGDVDGGDGDDTLDSHLGVLQGTLRGGAGSDTYIVAAGQIVSEGFFDDGASDTVKSYGDFTLPDHVENLYLLGSGTIGRGNNEENSIIGNDSGNRLFGGGSTDIILGGSGDDTLRGGDGNDALQSFEGADRFYGGNGDDLIYVGQEKVTVDGGAGLDIAVFIYNDAAIVADLTKAKIVTGGVAGTDVLKSIEGVWGSESDDTLTGNDAANNFLGYLGNDTIKGAGGDDVIEGYTGADVLDGGDGLDTLSYANAQTSVTANLLAATSSGGDADGDTFVSFENLRGGFYGDTLTGSAGANVLEGGAADDILSAGGGLDTLYGDAGNDLLTGGTAKDVFGFRDITNFLGGGAGSGGFGADTITDFQDGLDKISFVGNSQVHSFADLTITQSGTSTVIGVVGSTDQITLLGFQAANFTTADVVFGV